MFVIPNQAVLHIIAVSAVADTFYLLSYEILSYSYWSIYTFYHMIRHSMRWMSRLQIGHHHLTEWMPRLTPVKGVGNILVVDIFGQFCIFGPRGQAWDPLKSSLMGLVCRSTAISKKTLLLWPWYLTGVTFSVSDVHPDKKSATNSSFIVENTYTWNTTMVCLRSSFNVWLKW